MPGESKNVEKTKRWSADAMKTAVEVVIKKEMGYLKASKCYGLPLTTLKDYVRRTREQNAPSPLIVHSGRPTVLPPDLEKELEEYCIKMDNNYFGLRRRDVRRLAFQLAVQNNLPNPFSTARTMAGKKWLDGFLRRHPKLSFRRPQRISVARAQAFTDEAVGKYFEILLPELKMIDFKPSRVFNCDETGVTVVQHSSEKVLTFKGKRAVHKLKSAERGGLITVVFCMSASGQHIAPMVIYPRKNKVQGLKKSLPDESLIGYSKTGWITSQLFTQWFAFFVKKINSCKENPAVLIFDGHYSHTRNLDVINIAREHNVSLISLPPHTSGKTQPMDVCFMKPFKTYFSRSIETWMDTNEGKVLSHFTLTPLFSKAYKKTATITIAEAAFKRTGISPFDKYVFEDDPEYIITADETPESVHRRIEKQTRKISKSTSNQVNENGNIPIQPAVTPETSNQRDDDEIPALVIAGPSNLPPETLSSTRRVSPKDVRPIPRIPPQKPSSRRHVPTLISSSPHKAALISATAKRTAKEEEQKRKREVRESKRVEREANKESTKRKRGRPAIGSKQKTKSKEPQTKKSNGKQPVKKPKPSRTASTIESSSENDDDEFYSDESLTPEYDANDSEMEEDQYSQDDPDCQFCGWPYSHDQHGQEWIRCSQCYAWGHEWCDSAAEDCLDKQRYVCMYCLNDEA